MKRFDGGFPYEDAVSVHFDCKFEIKKKHLFEGRIRIGYFYNVFFTF